uniref:Uncharacterized protein n=1 Tax=Zea mays TaxID=4577 RepID=C4J1L7_MAIZE|nr:unknown [Zea mays]
MIILKGGIGSGYKKLIEEKGATGETYTTEGIALIRVSGTSIHNNKTLQVDTVALPWATCSVATDARAGALTKVILPCLLRAMSES